MGLKGTDLVYAVAGVIVNGVDGFAVYRLAKRAAGPAVKDLGTGVFILDARGLSIWFWPIDQCGFNDEDIATIAFAVPVAGPRKLVCCWVFFGVFGFC